MKTPSIAALLLAAACAPAMADEVLMLDHTPSVEELRSYLAPEPPRRTRGIEPQRTRGIEIVGQSQPAPAQPPQRVSTMAPEPEPAPMPMRQPMPERETSREQPKAEPTTIGYRVPFAYDSAELTPDAKPFLDQLGQVMQSEPSLRLMVEGHTDAHGSDGYNLGLSQRRAKAVQAYLSATWQIPSERLKVAGKGESEPLTADGNAAENRRVQFKPLGS